MKYRVQKPYRVDGKMAEVGTVLERRPSEALVKLGLRFGQLEQINDQTGEVVEGRNEPKEPAHTEKVPNRITEGGNPAPIDQDAKRMKSREGSVSKSERLEQARSSLDTRFKPGNRAQSGKQVVKDETGADLPMLADPLTGKIPEAARDGQSVGNTTVVDGNTGEVTKP